MKPVDRRTTLTFHGFGIGDTVYIIDAFERKVLEGVVTRVQLEYTEDESAIQAYSYDVRFSADQLEDVDEIKEDDGTVCRLEYYYEVFGTSREASNYLVKFLRDELAETIDNAASLQKDIKSIQSRLEELENEKDS